MVKRSIRLLLGLAVIMAVDPAFAQWGGGGGGGEGEGYGRFERVEIDPAATERLRNRMNSLGYLEWLRLNGVYKPRSRGEGIKAEISVDYRAGDSNHFPDTGPRIDPYFAKIVLMAAPMLGVDSDAIELSVRNIGNHEHFRSGNFIRFGGGGGRLIGRGAPVAGLVNNVRGTIPRGLGMQQASERIEAHMRRMGADPVVKFTDGNILVQATSSKDLVLKGVPGKQNLTLQLTREISSISGSGGSDGMKLKIGYLPAYYIVADGSLQPAVGGEAIPFDPKHFAELDAFVRGVAKAIDNPTSTP